MWRTGMCFLLLWTLGQSSNYDEITEPESLAEPETTFYQTETSPKSRHHRATPKGIAEYRSALTLDWLLVEDSRQRNLADFYGSKPTIPDSFLSTNCRNYPRPSSGKVARLLLELLKNLEGDNATLIIDLVQNLVHANLLMESKYFEEEPDLDSLLKVPENLRGEPHATFPKILTMLWLTLTDPATIKKRGWCSVKATSKFIEKNRPKDIAKQMRILDPVIARARYIMEDFIHQVTPVNMMTTKSDKDKMGHFIDLSDPRRQSMNGMGGSLMIQFGEPIMITPKSQISVPLVRLPMLDADGKVHESVNIVREQAPRGPIPNVKLTDRCWRNYPGNLIFVALLVFLQ